MSRDAQDPLPLLLPLPLRLCVHPGVGARNAWFLFIFSYIAIAFRGLPFKTRRKETWENEMFYVLCF